MKLREALKGKLSGSEMDSLKTAFDVVGDIAILEVGDSLVSKEELIANTLLNMNKNIKVVVKKVGAHSGVFRLQDYKVLAGEDRLNTVHVESGCRFKLDISKVYFSARLGTERLRISKLCKEGERVLVMFSGCGVYPIVISSNSKVDSIVGVEINPSGHEYGLENVKLNKVSNVTLINSDVSKVELEGKFDRVLMPWPKGGAEFLEVAKKYVKSKGIVHLYDFVHEDDFNLVEEKVKKVFKSYKKLDFVQCGQLAPRQWRVCLDFCVK